MKLLRSFFKTLRNALFEYVLFFPIILLIGVILDHYLQFSVWAWVWLIPIMLAFGIAFRTFFSKQRGWVYGAVSIGVGLGTLLFMSPLKLITWLIVIVIPMIILRGMLYVSRSWRDVMPIIFLWVGGFGIYFVSYFVFRYMDLFSPYQNFVTTGGLFFIIMTLFISNDERLKKSTLEKDKTPYISPAIKRLNIGIMIITLGIIAIGHLRIVQNAFIAMIGYIIRFIFSGGGADEEELIEEEPQGESGEMALPEGDNNFLQPIMKFLEAVVLVLLYIGMAGAVVLLILSMTKKSRTWLLERWRAFVEFLKRLTKSIEGEQSSPYTDEKETVFDWKRWREKQTDKAKGLFGKMFRRKQNWKALSNAEKVRAIYRDIVTPNMTDIKYTSALTARETLNKIEHLVETDDANMALLRRYYEDSRYSTKDIDDHIIQELSDMLKNLDNK